MAAPSRPPASLPAELWAQVIEHVMDYNPSRVSGAREMPERHELLRGLALVCRGWAPIAQSLLFREVALGVISAYNHRRTLVSLEAFLRAMDELTARGSRLPGAVRVLHIGIGQHGNKQKTMRLVCGPPADAARAIALCPNVYSLDLYVGVVEDLTPEWLRFSAGTMAAFAAMRHVRQLHFAVDETLTHAAPDGELVFGFLEQLLSTWTQVDTLCFQAPPNHRGELECPPLPHLRELRCCGVPPPSLLERLDEPGAAFQRLVLVDPALCSATADVTRFPEPLHVPSSTRELGLVGDFAAYSLTLSQAVRLRTVTWEWQGAVDPDPEALQRLADAGLPPSVDRLTLPAVLVVIAHAYGVLEQPLDYLSAQLVHLRRIILCGPAHVFDTYDVKRDEAEAEIRRVFVNVDVQWHEEGVFDPAWNTLPRPRA